MIILTLANFASATNYINLTYNPSTCSGTPPFGNDGGASYLRSQRFLSNDSYPYLVGASFYINSAVSSPDGINIRFTNLTSTKPNYTASYGYVQLNNSQVTTGAYNDFNFTAGNYPYLGSSHEMVAIFETITYSVGKYYSYCRGSLGAPYGDAYVLEANKATPSSWVLEDTQDVRITFYFADDNGTAPPPPADAGAYVYFNIPPTSSNNSFIQHNANITFNTTSVNFGGTFNTTMRLYNSSGGNIFSFVNSTTQIQNRFSNWSALGTYRFNATTANSTFSNKTTTYTLFVVSNANIDFWGTTPNNNSLFYYNKTGLNISLIAQNYINGSVKIVTNIYNSSGSLVLNYSNTTFNVSNNFSLPYIGNFYINATGNDSIVFNRTTTRTLTSYKIMIGNFTNPLNNSVIDRSLNVTWSASTFNPTNSALNLYYTLTLLNSDLTVNHTIKANNTNTTSFFWNFSTNTSISRGNYYLKLTTTDNKSNSEFYMINISINDTGPTIPYFNQTAAAFYYNSNVTFEAINSSDVDGDTVTIYYKIVSQNGVILQDFSVSHGYVANISQVGTNITVIAKGVTNTLNSSEVNFSAPVYIDVHYTFIREKTNLPFNITDADEAEISIICQDDVFQETLTTNTFSSNVTCEYDFIKMTLTYGADSYFRILTPDFEDKNVTFYLLDLNYDTAIERILIINDITGSYSSGRVLIQRYINNSQVTIIEEPFDIERSADLFLLKDQLYTVTIINNDDEANVLGNLIASAAGTSTITLPNLDFYIQNSISAEGVDWNYTYSNNDTGGYITLVYGDAYDQTTYLYFIVRNESEGIVFQTSFSSPTNTTSSIVITYTPLSDANQTYYSEFYFEHELIGIVNESRLFIPGQSIATGEILNEEANNNILEGGVEVVYWLALLFIIAIGLSFDARNSHIGLPVVIIFLSIFTIWGFVYFGVGTSIVTALLGVVAVLNLLSKSRRETGGD